ncbi:helix-turn-helix domain-containing protein [bacterium]|nr:helix-turn-helix domain-containing protein [bacterium]
MDDWRKFSRLIKFHRKQSHLSQSELADLAGVGKTAVYDIEKGKTTVQFDTLTKVLQALNIKIVFESPLMQDFEESADAKS